DGVANDGVAGQGANVGADMEQITTAGTGNNTISAVGVGAAVTLIGGDGNDTITGGGGNDLIKGGKGANYLDGQAGDDTVVGQGVLRQRVIGGVGNDS